jgi:H+/Cl- antiporter ClcA
MLPLSANILWRVAILAVICAAVSAVFCVHHARLGASWPKDYMPDTFIRAAVGGALIIALTYAVGSTDYNGTGMDVITRAVQSRA